MIKILLRGTVIMIILAAIAGGCVYYYLHFYLNLDTVNIEQNQNETSGENTATDIKDIVEKLSMVIDDEDSIIIPSKLQGDFLPYIDKGLFSEQQIIFEKDNDKWASPLDFLGKNAKWVVFDYGDKKNAIYNLLETKKGNVFSKYYSLEFEGRSCRIYKLKEKRDIPIIIYKGQFIWRFDKFVARGINSYDLVYMTNPEIEELFKTLQGVGINTIRFWAFRDGEKDGIQVEAGIMNEDKLKSLDFVLATANKYEIHLIPVLVNNWNDFGGREQYAKWTGFGNNKDAFYSEIKIKKLFKNYIDHIVPRKNTITNIYYRDDSSILAWELMNEPRSLAKKNILKEWTMEMSAYLKEKDPNHLVYIGSEMEIGKVEHGKALELCSLENIDICSAHIYLYDKDVLLYKKPEGVSDFIIAQKDFAQQNGKPLLIGEFGISEKKEPYGNNSLEVMEQITEIFKKNNLNGYLIWNWEPTCCYDSFSFGVDNDRKYNLEQLKKIIDGSDKGVVPSL